MPIHIQRVGIRMSKSYKAFLYGMAFGSFLMFLLLLPSVVKASDENGEVICMAKNIYFEAGNQPLAGKVAVAQVVLNRMEHSAYADDVCGVVYDAQWRENWKGNMVPIINKCQFSWFCDGKSDDPEDSKTWLKCLTLARNILQGEYGDITEGATHYHSVYVNPYWADSLNQTVTINEHIFYK